MNFKGIIFDLDGVIVHTDKLHYKAWKIIADRVGAKFDEEINNFLRGVSRSESLEIILKTSNLELSKIEKDILEFDKNEVYKKLLLELNESSIDQEIKITLDKLKKQNIKLAIGSSSKNALTILNQTKMKDYFDAISDGNNITRTKPDPEVFLKAAQYLNLLPQECVVVEDAVAGILAAKAGNFFSIAIGDAALSNLADKNIKNLSDVLSFELA